MNGLLDIHPKVVAGGLAGALAIVIVWALGLRGIAVPPVPAAALVTILSALGGYFAPPGYQAATAPAEAPTPPAA